VLTIIGSARYGVVVLAAVSLGRTAVFVAIRIAVLRTTCAVPLRTFRRPLTISLSALVCGGPVHLAVVASGLTGHGPRTLLQVALFGVFYPVVIRTVARDTYEEFRTTARRALAVLWRRARRSRSAVGSGR
jgi:hypothetical protein